jgi:5-methylcytosine-specific restriction endonuclease McrA
MAFDADRLKRIYNRTCGYCHLCHKKLALTNYGRSGAKGGWHVEHSRARANGGSDHGNNLYPACISCNIEKGTVTTATARASHGKSRAPLSRKARSEAKADNAVFGAVVAGAAGGALFGPIGALGGAILGALNGHGQNPDR